MGSVRKIYSLLSARERRTAYVLLGLMTVGAALETLSVGLVVPALAILVQGVPTAVYPPLRPLLAAMLFLTEGLVLCGIASLLLIVQPVGAVIVGASLASAAWGFRRLTHGPIVAWGAARPHHEGMRIQHLQQGLGGAKDVKLLG